MPLTILHRRAPVVLTRPEPVPPPYRTRRFWTADQDDTLRRLWDSDIPASAIAEAMGEPFTRDAVIGRANRLGLRRRPSPIVRPGPRLCTPPSPTAPKATLTTSATHTFARKGGGNAVPATVTRRALTGGAGRRGKQHDPLRRPQANEGPASRRAADMRRRFNRSAKKTPAQLEAAKKRHAREQARRDTLADVMRAAFGRKPEGEQ